MSMIRKTCAIEVITKRETGGRIRISTAGFDRVKDRVLPRGVQLANYEKNPVVQWGHNYEAPWATIGKTTALEVFDDYIEAEFELRPAANEHDPQNIVLLLWQGGWIRTASIGFNPLQAKGNSQGGRDFTSSELLEWSLVPIPMNQDALKLAFKGFELPALAVPLAVKELSLDKLVSAVFDALYRALYTDAYWHGDERIEMWPVAVYPTYAIVQIALEFYRVEYVIEDGRVLLQERDQWVLVAQAWIEEPTDMAFAKSAFTKALASDPRNVKAGARHSKADQEALQAMHDLAVQLGAACATADEAKGVSTEVSAPDPSDSSVDVSPLVLALRELRTVVQR